MRFEGAWGFSIVLALSYAGITVSPRLVHAQDEELKESPEKAGSEQSNAKSKSEPLTDPDDAFFLELAESSDEVIVVFSERPEKPFERDTELRITQETLRKRSITSVADALALLPDVRVRAAGRGGQQVGIRGARRGSIKILIDGVPISDPYFGNIDLSSIPVTDIVQIRVSKIPASPIDGTGGPGGVIEIHTRDAYGDAKAYGQVQVQSVPEGLISATARTPLAGNWYVRGSATARIGRQQYSVSQADEPTSFNEGRNQFAGALRLEYRKGERRFLADVYGQKQELIAPPDVAGEVIRAVDDETRLRAALSYDDSIGKWQLQGRGYFAALTRDSSLFNGAQIETESLREDLDTKRFGGAFLINRKISKGAHRFTLIASTAFDAENGEQTDIRGGGDSTAGGDVSTVQGALAVHYVHGDLIVRASGGAAVPLGINAAPWPEFKLAVEYPVMPKIDIKVAVGRKGRVPTLRERFGLTTSNETLGPEQALYGEFEGVARPFSWLRVRAIGFARETTDIIRINPDTGSLFNLGDVSIRGTELVADIGDADSIFNGGGSWTYTKAVSSRLGDDPLDFLPANRVQFWLRSPSAAVLGGNLRLFWDDKQIDQAVFLPTRGAFDLSLFTDLASYLITVRAQGTLTVGNRWAFGENYQIRTGVFAPGLIYTLGVQREW